MDLRIFDETRYVEAATLLVTCNAQPYSQRDWHWRLLVAHRFGHAASVPAMHAALKLLDDAGLAGELALRETRTGRVETVQMWGRPESVREEFRKLTPRSVVRPLDGPLAAASRALLSAAGRPSRTSSRDPAAA